MALVVLDAGVVIAALDRRDTHYEAALRELRMILRLSDELVLPVSAYAELLVAPSGGDDDAVALVDDLLDRLQVRVEPANRTIAKTAALLRARHPAVERWPTWLPTTSIGARSSAAASPRPASGPSAGWLSK